MTDVRLAHGGPPNALQHGLELQPAPRYRPPALLVSYWYWEGFAARRHLYNFRDYSLDSGAFSAHHSGAVVDLDKYIEHCAELFLNDPQCAEVFSLDVIGDWRASLANTEKMWGAGVPAIPVYHVGEPEHVLKHMAATYPKIALGGAVGLKGGTKIAWAKRCFASVWPAAIHGLGYGTEGQLMALPWHSVDATNWEAGPTRFGNWLSMPGGSIRGGNQPLRMEVEHYLRMEERATSRWRKEMTLLAERVQPTGPTVRLGARSNRAESGLAEPAPALRLAVSGVPNSHNPESLGGDPPTLRLAVSGLQGNHTPDSLGGAPGKRPPVEGATRKRSPGPDLRLAVTGHHSNRHVNANTFGGDA